MGEQRISRTYDIKTPVDRDERLFASHTDFVETPEGISLTEKLQKDNERHDKDLNDFHDALTVRLIGEVTGQAKIGTGETIQIQTKPSKKYVQKVKLIGSVTGEALADSFENGICTIETKYDRSIPQTVKLTGDVTGNATVDRNGIISIQCTAKKVSLPVDSVQLSLASDAEVNLKTVFGGTWECMGKIDGYIGGQYDATKSAYSGGTPANFYVYKKTAL